MKQYIHKVNGIPGKTSLNIVIPKNILQFLSIRKGDFVEINRIKDKIIINRLTTKQTQSKDANIKKSISLEDRSL